MSLRLQLRRILKVIVTNDYWIWGTLISTELSLYKVPNHFQQLTVMAAVARLLSSESLCMLRLIYRSLARFPISDLKLNREVSQHELLFVSKTISRPELRSFMTPTIESVAKGSEDNRVVNVLCLHLFSGRVVQSRVKITQG